MERPYYFGMANCELSPVFRDDDKSDDPIPTLEGAKRVIQRVGWWLSMQYANDLEARRCLIDLGEEMLASLRDPLRGGNIVATEPEPGVLEYTCRSCGTVNRFSADEGNKVSFHLLPRPGEVIPERYSHPCKGCFTESSEGGFIIERPPLPV